MCVKDFSILVVKPEIIGRKKDIVKSLVKRGYKVILEKKVGGWRNAAKKLYTEFLPEQIGVYLEGYDKYCFGDAFTVFVLKHKDGDTIRRLKKNEGDFIRYQTQDEKTLRAEFGLPENYNQTHGEITFVYCGFHCPKDENELKSQLELFAISMPE